MTAIDNSINQKRQELKAFLFLTVVLAPTLVVAIVGSYGLLIWLYQLFNGATVI